MASILYTGFGSSLQTIKHWFKDHDFIEVPVENVTFNQMEEADLFLIGPEVNRPVQALQNVSKKNEIVSTILIARPKEYATLKQSLLFTAFLGKNAQCVPENESLQEELNKALGQTRQRRKFNKINRSLIANIERNQNVNNTELIGNFLDQAPIGAIIMNKERTIIAINRFARQQFRIQPLEKVRQLADIFPETLVSQILQNLSSSRATQELYFASVYYELTFAEIFSERKENLDILLFTDITEKKLENQRIRNVLDALPQMAWTTNADGEVTYFTEGWYRYTGQTHSEAMGEGYKNAIHPDDLSHLLSTWLESVRSKTPLDNEARYRKHTGEYRWHVVRGIPVLSGERVLYWLGVCTDIHDQKMQEQILKEKVEERTRDLKEVNSLLERSNNDLKEFAYVASHDLKEPVRKIKLFIDRYQESETEEERGIFIEKIDYTADGMLELIEGIISYSQLSGTVSREPVNLNEVIAASVLTFELIIEAKNAKVTFKDLPFVNGVKAQLIQLFNNLISNSLKYSERAPEIIISSGEVQKDGKRFIVIDVSDNGIGFEEKYTGDIFTIFKRLHTKDRYPGSGIGLALVEKIMMNHRGTVSAKSEPGKGSVFSLYFPAD